MLHRIGILGPKCRTNWNKLFMEKEETFSFSFFFIFGPFACQNIPFRHFPIILSKETRKKKEPSHHSNIKSKDSFFKVRLRETFFDGQIGLSRNYIFPKIRFAKKRELEISTFHENLLPGPWRVYRRCTKNPHFLAHVLTVSHFPNNSPRAEKQQPTSIERF